MNIKIKKIKLTKGRTLEVELTEYANIGGNEVSNEIIKKCDYIAHQDFIDRLEALSPHVINICELRSNSDEIKVTGFSIAEGAESDGVTIVAQKKLSTGKVLNLVTPFTEFIGDYDLSSELEDAISECLRETQEYLDGKCAIKQATLNFDEDDETATIEVSAEPKKRGRKKKEVEPELMEAV